MFALVDANSFYCSCERVFNPSLRDNPVVVLSNNDGCIIALTPKAKALGIKMGTPYFQNREVLEKNNVHVFSSNYALYGDMSRRVMQVIARFAPAFEIYSIDECFLQVDGISDLSSFGRAVREVVLQETGIPCGVGIGQTKTLAKIANRAAKKGGWVVRRNRSRVRLAGFALGCPWLAETLVLNFIAFDEREEGEAANTMADSLPRRCQRDCSTQKEGMPAVPICYNWVSRLALSSV
jgi:nucleotidyltransferase/DNA polymerase involved in DNA repair